MFKITFDRKSLIKQLRFVYDGAIFARGEDYFRKGRVGKLKISGQRAKEKIRIEARISGSEVYATSILFNLLTNRFDNPSCNCPYDWGSCKHGVALGLKFIDLWEDLYDLCDEFDNFEEIKNQLLIMIDAEGESFEIVAENENEEDCREAEVFELPEEKEEKILNPEKFTRLKQLLKLIGIDADSLSEKALEELGDKFALKTGLPVKNSPAKKENNKLAIPKKKTEKRFGEKYCLIVNNTYGIRLDIEEKAASTYGYGYGWRRNSVESILEREGGKLNQEEKDFLLSLKEDDFWRDDFDWGKAIKLAKNIGMDIYLGKKTAASKLEFAANPEKITVEVYKKENNDYYNEERIPHEDFVFKLNADFYDEKKTTLLSGKTDFAIIGNGRIELHEITPSLSGIISRIFKAARDYYGDYSRQYRLKYEKKYGERLDDFSWETEFFEDEVLNINNILEDSRKYFNLETGLGSFFKVNKFQKIGSAMRVDYNGCENYLRVSATIDYAFSKIDVGHTVYRSMRGGVPSLVKNPRRNREKYHIQILEDEINYARIDEKAEIELFRKFHEDAAYGFGKKLKCVRKGQKQIAHYRENHWPQIKSLNYPIEFVRDEFNFFEEEFKANFDVDMNAENDWLAFDVDCYLGKDRISLADLKNYLKNKEEFIRMNDGRLLRISNWDELERFILMLESFYQRENGSFEGKAYHAPELENLFVNSKYYSAKVAEGFKKFMAEAQSGRPLKKVKLPTGINKILRDYQKDGLHWFHFLRKYRFAGILADDMGLGKTLQALTLLAMNKLEKKPSIVICPKTLLFNWEDEAKKFFPNLAVLIIEGFPKVRAKSIGKIKNYDLVITSYSTLKKDEEIYAKKKIKFNYCFLDEAQFIKNHKTQNARAVKKVDADYKLALTGTPLENSVSEVWSMFDFLMPGFLGNYNQFTKKFLTPIMKKNDAGALQALRKKTECFMLRRTKSEVLKELPPKIEQIVTTELTEAQNILYQEILANVKSEIEKTVAEKGFAKSQIHILAGLMKLRQVCNHPTLLLKNKNYAKYESAKLESFKELIGEIVSAGRKVLVFSQFTQMLDILADVLKKDKIDYLYLSGKTKNRKELVAEFNGNDKKKVFLISLKAGGTGLNLTSADNVIIFDPWWNPSVENQAIDRTHRIGQKNSVNVYRLITKGTIEEKIVKLQEKKKFLFDNLVGESKDLFKKLTWGDVRELFL